MKKIIVTIDPMGSPKIEAQGFMGASCEAATASLEKALAAGRGETTVTEHKPEFYASEEEQAQNQQSW